MDDAEGPLQDHIHDRLAYYFDALSRPWEAPLQFPMHVGLVCAEETLTKDIDICSFVSGKHPDSSYSPFAYFDRSKFPFVDQPRVSPKLHSALVEASALARFLITSSGRSYTKSILASRKKFPRHSTPPIGSVTYVCSRYNPYRSSNTQECSQRTHSYRVFILNCQRPQKKEGNQVATEEGRKPSYHGRKKIPNTTEERRN